MTTGIGDAVFSNKCVECDSNCATCFIEPHRCMSCHRGFRIGRGNRCVGRFTVELFFEFNMDYAEFLDDGMYQELIDTLAVELSR